MAVSPNPRAYPNFPDGEADIARAYEGLASAVSVDVQSQADSLQAQADSLQALADGETSLEKVTSSGDVKVTDDTKGIVLLDRTTGLPVRLFVDNGVIGLEAE